MLTEKVKAALQSPEYMAAIQAGANQLKVDFPQIIQGIKVLSPGAKIYVNNLYNPMTAKDPLFGGLYPMYEGICNQINTQLLAGSSPATYTVIDAYSLLKAEGAVNFNVTNFDPHPTTAGHAIADGNGKAVLEIGLKTEGTELLIAVYNKDQVDITKPETLFKPLNATIINYKSPKEEPVTPPVVTPTTPSTTTTTPSAKLPYTGGNNPIATILVGLLTASAGLYLFMKKSS